MQKLLSLEMSAEVRAEVLTIIMETVASLSVTNPSLVTPGALRQRRYRDRHQASLSVTKASPSVTGDKVLYDVKEVKEDNSTSEKSVTPHKRGSRVPPNFKPDEASWLWAKKKYGVTDEQLVEVTEEFQDFWDANPGVRGVKLDWNKTWRNRCREKLPRLKPKDSANGSSIPNNKLSAQPTETREQYLARLAKQNTSWGA